MIGPERSNKVVIVAAVPAVVSKDPSHRWIYNSWRVLVTETADGSVVERALDAVFA